MKFIVAVVILCTFKLSCAQLTCELDIFRQRATDCFKINQMGTMLQGDGLLEMQHICSYGKLGEFSACMVNLSQSCAPDWYDSPRMADAVNRICRSQDFCPSTDGKVGLCAEFCSKNSDCGEGKICCSNGCGHDCSEPSYSSDNCNVKDSSVAMCVAFMKRSWEEKRIRTPEAEGSMFCQMIGGVKDCITKNMMDSCKSKSKYLDLIDSFGNKECIENKECDICEKYVHVRAASTMTTSSVTTSLACIAGISFLRNLL